MSGDVQPRKRKDKRRKKEDLTGSEDVGSSTCLSDETIHIHKDAGTGGNICAKVVFFLLLGALAVMVGLILTEYRGSSDVDTPVAESRWAQVFDGWVDESPPKHDEHDELLGESGEHSDEHSEEAEERGDDEHDEHEEEEEEEEEVESEEAQSPEEEEEEEQAPEESEEGLEEEEEEADEEEEEEEGEDEEPDEEQEVSEEELDGIPGVTESDEEEDEEGDDESAGAEDDDSEVASEEAAGEEDEARRMSTVAPEVKPMTETSTKLPTQTHSQSRESLSKEMQEMQQSKDRLVVVLSEGERETPNIQIKSEEVKQEPVSQSAAKLTTSDPQSVQLSKPDRANKVPDRSAISVSAVQDIPASYGRDGKAVVQQHTSETTSTTSSQRLSTSHTSEKIVTHTPTDKPTVQHIPTEKTIFSHTPTEKPAVSHIPTGKTTIPQTPTKKPGAPHIPAEKAGAPHIPAEKASAVHTATEESTIPHTSTEKPTVQHIPTEKPSSSCSQVPPPTVTHLKTASQAAHVHDLRGDKLELSIAEKVTEVHSYSEHSKSVGVKLAEEKPVLSQVSSKVPEDGTKQDICITQQQKDVEGSQKAQTPSQKPDLVTQSAGNVPKEASVFADRGASKIPESGKNASRTSASKHKKEEGEDSDEDDGDKNNGDEEDVEEAEEEEVGEGEPEGDSESGHEEDGGDNGSEDEPSGVTRAADITPEESGTEEEESEEEEIVPVRRATKSSGGQGYEKTDISSEDDLKIREDLDLADAEMEEKPEEALHAFTAILVTNPTSPRAHHGKARALDQLAEKKHSNALLQEAIDAYESVLALGASVPDKLFVQAAERCINRMRFKGQYHTAIHIHKKLIQRFSENPAHPNQLAVTYLMINRLADAKRILEDTLRHWPDNGFAQVHYGFILKTGDNNNGAAVDYLTRGIATREPGTIDGRFFFHLGDALTRLGRHDEASKIYELGVREGLFLSKYQRSLYNINRLRAQPWWTAEETTYSKYFKKLQDNWQQIREEGLVVLANKTFKDEAENLKDVGNWQQFELYARGRRIASSCLKAPFTCQLISEFPAARDCRRGQAKFSVMHAGTHVWPHCGPTNCRLRSHLGLIVPEGTYIRVAEETRTWEEGKLFVFDDSFEHEVWHNGTTTRLVLIVDVWHPELTEDEKRSMPAI